MSGHGFTFFEQLPGVNHNNLHMVTAGFVVLMLTAVSLGLYPQLKAAAQHVLPTRKFGVRAVMEVLVEMLASLAKEVIGEHYRRYLPFVGTVFFFIFFCNILGVIPGFLPPTEQWVTGAAVALIVFLTYNLFGFSAHGPGYLKHFFAPLSLKGVKNIVLWAALLIPMLMFQVLFGAIELISSLIRPITLSIRLAVNIAADHMVLSIFSDLIPLGLPIVFLLLGIFVSFIQAFIFTMLTMVYISLAVAHNHDE